MLFKSPIDFSEALRILIDQDLMPTDMSSEELRSLGVDVRERSLFSAKTNNVRYLQEVRDSIGELTNGDVNISTARARLQAVLDSLGYEPEQSGIQDLSSSERVDLVVSTNARQVANFALRARGAEEMALRQFPCWELVRIYPREIPRGQRKGAKGRLVDVPEDSWPERWERAGGELIDGRMIARKDSPIWDALGDASNFDDGLDTAYPPFAFNSGMGWMEVARGECISLGIIDPEEQVEPPIEGNLNDQFEAGSGIDKDFLQSLSDELGGEIKAGKLRLANSLDAIFEEVMAA
jgi:hypothetical protein